MLCKDRINNTKPESLLRVLKFAERTIDHDSDQYQSDMTTDTLFY